MYDAGAYEVARKNTKYNKKGEAVISSDDEWIEETEWDEIAEKAMKEMTNMEENKNET